MSAFHPAKHPWINPGVKCYVLGQCIPVSDGYENSTLKKDYPYEAEVISGTWKKRHEIYRLYVRVRVTHTVDAWLAPLTQTFTSEELCEDVLMRTPYGK